MNAFEVQVRRDGRFWAIYVPEVDRWTQARNLREVDAMARDLVSIMLGVDTDTVSLDVKYEMPTDAREHLDRAAQLRARAADASRRASDEYRATARTLRASGLAVNDIADLLGVSKQRISQLLSEAAQPGSEVDEDEDLLAHIKVEFLEHGRRAVEFLRAAKELLTMPPRSLPRQAELIGYCLREAMTAIPASQDLGGAGRWDVTSRSVVKAKKRLELIEDLDEEERKQAVENLFAKIDDMALIHEQERIHQQRLIAAIVNRTGAEPLSMGMDPVRGYQELLNRCHRAVHHELEFTDAKRLYDDCMTILRQLFMPPTLRHHELDALAEKVDPNGADVASALGLIAGPRHLERLLSRIQTTRWLDLLDDSDVLDPPRGQAPWPVFAAVDSLKDVDPAGVADFLNRLFERWGDDPQRTWYIARAAVDLGVDGRDLTLRAAQSHPASLGLALLAVEAVRYVDPMDEFVEQVADVVLNPAADRDLHVAPLLRSLADGMRTENYARRIRLLCWKLGNVAPDDRARRSRYYDRGGSIEDPPGFFGHEYFNALLRGLVQCLRRALDVAEVADIMGALEPLPNDLAHRARAWVLGHAPHVDAARLVAEVIRAVGTRLPTGDDIRLVERVLSEIESAQLANQLTEVLPPPPSVTELGTALRDDRVPDDWIRVFEWSGLLPAEAITPWAASMALLSAQFGERTRTSLEEPMWRVVDSTFRRSPLTEIEIQDMPADDAARQIASWRPDPADWPSVGLSDLALALENAVKANPASWGESPLKLVGLLRYPGYIAHYLRGLAAAESLARAAVDELVDTVTLIRTHPWNVVQLSSDSLASDVGWREAEHASIELIKSMAASDVGFGDRLDEIWAILRDEITQRDERADLETNLDPLESAINRPCTRALQAALVFMGHEYRIDQRVRPEALELLSSILELPGQGGAEHRAILATSVGFLHRIAPDWLEQRREQLFGDAAPSGLGQQTIDLALKWGQPNNWLLEHYPAGVADAVRRNVDNALEHYLIAMLRQRPGYSVQQVVATLRPINRISEAAEVLGRLLRDDGVPAPAVGTATAYWAHAVESHQGENLDGFGWFAEIRGIDNDTWVDLTLKTLKKNRGRIDWRHRVAERSAASPPNTTTLSIMNALVRSNADEWDKRNIGELGVRVLEQGTSLSDTPEYNRLQTTLIERGHIR